MRYLLGHRGDCLLEYHFCGGDQRQNVVYREDTRDTEAISNPSMTVFVAGQSGTEKEVKGIALTVSTLPAELRAVRITDVVVFGRIIIICGVRKSL